jgi:uncharacterized protein YkwD
VTYRRLTRILRATAAALSLTTALGGLGALTAPPFLDSLPGRLALPAVSLPVVSLPVVRTAHSARADQPVDVSLTPATQMTRLVNADRATHGLSAVRFDQAITTVARRRSEDMVTRGYFSHDIGNVPGLLVFDLLRSQGISYRRAGENLAETYLSADRSAAWAEDAMMRSPTHRANILAPDYTHLGVGVAVGSDGRTVFTQLFKAAW